MSSSLSDVIQSKVDGWVKDRTINPTGCKVEIHSVYPSKKTPGEFDINFDVAYSYAIWIQALLTPFYILFGLLSIYEGIEYLEDIAYFKRFTPRGIAKKRIAMAETKVRLYSLMLDACKAYNKCEDTQHG